MKHREILAYKEIKQNTQSTPLFPPKFNKLPLTVSFFLGYCSFDSSDPQKVMARCESNINFRTFLVICNGEEN